VRISAGLSEFFPVPGLIHAEAGEIRGPTHFEPGCPQGVGYVVISIFIKDRAMSGIF
jgi:hypothetical protein